MAFKTGRFYTFDNLADYAAILTVNGSDSSLANAQGSVSGRLRYDQAAGQKYHYEIFERMSNGDLILRQTDKNT